MKDTGVTVLESVIKERGVDLGYTLGVRLS